MKTTIDAMELAAACLASAKTLQDIAARLSAMPETARDEFKPVRKVQAKKSFQAVVRAIRLPSVADQYAALQAAVKAGRLGYAGCPGFIARKMREAMATGKPFDPAFKTAIEAAYAYNRRFLA